MIKIPKPAISAGATLFIVMGLTQPNIDKAHTYIDVGEALAVVASAMNSDGLYIVANPPKTAA
jgi:hypothetical protein